MRLRGHSRRPRQRGRGTRYRPQIPDLAHRDPPGDRATRQDLPPHRLRRPAQHCDIHHKIHWADNGPTNYDNGVLACRHHHTQLHRYGATFEPDGRFAITRTRQRRE
ncbi:MAG: HNH endonuclease signature motif containing protein [Gammaproteobacteria bacterium]